MLERAQRTRNEHVLVVARRLLLDEVGEGLARLCEVRRGQNLHLIRSAKADDAVEGALVGPKAFAGLDDRIHVLLGRIARKRERDLGVG